MKFVGGQCLGKICEVNRAKEEWPHTWPNKKYRKGDIVGSEQSTGKFQRAFFPKCKRRHDERRPDLRKHPIIKNFESLESGQRKPVQSPVDEPRIGQSKKQDGVEFVKKSVEASVISHAGNEVVVTKHQHDAPK